MNDGQERAAAPPAAALERQAEPERDEAVRVTTPPWARRAIALFWLSGVGVFAAFWLLARLQSLIVILLVSLVLSFALEPVVNRLESLGIRRGVGVLLSFVGLTALLALFGYAMATLVNEQVVNLIDKGPRYIQSAQDWANRTFDANINTEDLIAQFQEGGSLGRLATNLAGNIYDIGARVLALLFQALTVLLFTFYLVADGPRLRRTICSMFPPDRQRELLRVWEIGIEKTGGYIVSRALLALLSTLFHSLAFAAIGVPSPLPLALWVGVISQFVPVIGTYLAGVLPLLIAVVERPVSAPWVLVVIVIYQQLENYLLAPRITASTMEIHAAVAFGSVIAGAAILGPIGALLALPIAATTQAFVSTYVRRHEVVSSALVTRRTRRFGRRARAERAARNAGADPARSPRTPPAS
ncbi:MAG: AI-2E family transporter [Acidimicrobiales bacterium]